MGAAKTTEHAVCGFLEALLRLEYPGRRVAVTTAPFVDGLPEEVICRLDGSGVVDVLIGALQDDAAWASFRCVISTEVQVRNWPAAATIVLQRARREFARWPGAGVASCNDSEESELPEVLLEAARRANWDAQHGPPHLRTGRFDPTRSGR